MPIPATARIPPPNSEEEFEDMVADALRVRFDNPHLVRFGRPGQRQSGIDGFDPATPLGRSMVWQSSLQSKRIVEKIEEDLLSMDGGLPGQPWLFVAALGMERDAALQGRLKELHDARVAQGRCGVLPLFWNEIRDAICSKDGLARKWFPTFYALPQAAEPPPPRPTPTDEAAYWASIIQRMATDWLNWCFDSNQLQLMNRIPIVRINRLGGQPVTGFPIVGRWDTRMGSFVPTHGDASSDTVRVQGFTDVRLATVTGCDDVTKAYLMRLTGLGSA